MKTIKIQELDIHNQKIIQLLDAIGLAHEEPSQSVVTIEHIRNAASALNKVQDLLKFLENEKIDAVIVDYVSSKELEQEKKMVRHLVSGKFGNFNNNSNNKW